MALKVPQHRADSSAVYVCAEDSAWLPDAKETAAEWRSGRGRYTPETLAPLIDQAQPPTMWRMERASLREFVRIQGIRQLGNNIPAFFEAARVCLRGVDGHTCDSWQRGQAMNDAEFEQLDAKFGRQILIEVGSACFMLLSDLTEDEKKA